MIVDPATRPASGAKGLHSPHLPVAGGLASLRHRHEAEDGFLCLLDGTGPATLFISGSRLAEDACHYPDIDLHYSRRNGLRTFAMKDGIPYPGWPKETQK